MRMLFTLVLASIAFFSRSQTQTTITATSGEWDKTTTWDLSRAPQDNDIVVIPDGVTVVVKRDVYNDNKVSQPNLTIQIWGILQFEPSGVLNLGPGSSIQLANSDAKITSTVASASEVIYIDGAPKYLALKTQTLSGPAYANNATGDAPNGFSAGVLPIKLKSFTAQAQASKIALKWSTAEELNSSHFIVEKSTDARQWSPVQTVVARGEAADYSAFDAAPAGGDNYYRLKSVDIDGKTEYSHVLKVARSRSLTAYVSPNPARSQVTVSLSTASAAPLHLQLVATNGQVVKEGYFSPGSSLLRLPLQGATAGLYTLVLREGASVIEAAQLLVQ